MSVDFAAADAARQVIRAYLSRQHFDDIDRSCPLVAVPSDVARGDPTVKRVFEEVFKAMVDLFRKGLRRNDADGRRRALAMAGICVGGMVVARARRRRLCRFPARGLDDLRASPGGLVGSAQSRPGPARNRTALIRSSCLPVRNQVFGGQGPELQTVCDHGSPVLWRVFRRCGEGAVTSEPHAARSSTSILRATSSSPAR